jgi:D-sedoheptulose 7-phosphate isomerase
VTAGRRAAVTDPGEQSSGPAPGAGGQGGLMAAAPGAGGPAGPVVAAFERRLEPGRDLADRAEQIAKAAHAMAVRFHRGGKLVVFGTGAASTDAQHVAVEFVHPVIVGKRAFPAISLTCDAATLTGVAAREGMANVYSHQIKYLAEPADIALGIAPDPACPSVLGGLRAAREAGLLTVALAGGSGAVIAADGCADHLLAAGSADPRIIKEVHVTTYHVLWELVHVFFEQPGVLGPGVVS